MQLPTRLLLYPSECVVLMCMQPCTVLIDGKAEGAVLSQLIEVGQGVKEAGLHQGSMHSQNRIHSYLFSKLGYLVHANEAAHAEWESRGA